MIELTKEKSFNSKDSKLGLPKSTIMFDKLKATKFTSSTTSPVSNDNKIIVYLGMKHHRNDNLQAEINVL